MCCVVLQAFNQHSITAVLWLERAATPSSDALKKRLITDPNPNCFLLIACNWGHGLECFTRRDFGSGSPSRYEPTLGNRQEIFFPQMMP
jgi:hypothetical protein